MSENNEARPKIENEFNFDEVLEGFDQIQDKALNEFELILNKKLVIEKLSEDLDKTCISIRELKENNFKQKDALNCKTMELQHTIARENAAITLAANRKETIQNQINELEIKLNDAHVQYHKKLKLLTKLFKEGPTTYSDAELKKAIEHEFAEIDKLKLNNNNYKFDIETMKEKRKEVTEANKDDINSLKVADKISIEVLEEYKKLLIMFTAQIKQLNLQHEIDCKKIQVSA